MRVFRRWHTGYASDYQQGDDNGQAEVGNGRSHRRQCADDWNKNLYISHINVNYLQTRVLTHFSDNISTYTYVNTKQVTSATSDHVQRQSHGRAVH